MKTSGMPTKVQWKEWLALAIVFFAIVGFSISSPRFAAPDEAAHQATAWYVTTYGMPPQAEGEAYVPRIFADGACFATNGRQDASCVPPRQVSWPELVRVLNYPPPYYWVAGIGQQVAGAIGTQAWLDVGGRVGSVLLNVGGLTLLALMLRRHYPQWGTYVLLIATPMAAFLWATVNPSGWEITAGLLFAFFFARAWWGARDGNVSNHWPLLLAISISAVLFALARHSAMVWMALVMLAVIASNRSILPRMAQWWVLLATLPGFIAGIAWQVTHPAVHVINNPDRIENPQGLDFLHYLFQIEDFLPVRLRQMVGVLGWLDTPVPQWMFYLLLIGWAALMGLLFARTRIPVLFLAIGFLGVFLVPSVMEMVRWNDWPYWYQGRITLPFALPFLLLVLMRFGRTSPIAVQALALVSGGILTFMVWQNLMRYAFGIWDYIPERWTDPAVSPMVYITTYALISAMILSLTVLMVSLLRTRTVRATTPRVGALSS